MHILNAMNLIGLDANQLDVAKEGLADILIFYVILDVGTHLSMYALGESLRRILSISGIFLAISFVLLLIYVQLFDKSTAQSTFVVIWIGSLAASLFASWKLYHRMLEHSSLIQDRESDVVKIANRQSEEMLKPLKNELSTVQKTMQKNTSIISLLGEAVLTNDNSLVKLRKSVEYAEQLTKRYKEKLSVSEDIAFEILNKNWVSNVYSNEKKEKEDYENAKNMIQTLLQWYKNNPNVSIDAEKRFQITIAGVPVNGSIDRVEQSPSGEYHVIDFKTGKAYETSNSIKQDTQMNVYALAVQDLYGKLPEKTSLFYIKENKMIDNLIKTDTVEKVKNTLEDITKSILNEEFEAKPEKGACFFCNFKSICDFVEND